MTESNDRVLEESWRGFLLIEYKQNEGVDRCTSSREILSKFDILSILNLKLDVLFYRITIFIEEFYF